MRRILVEQARRKATIKRGGDRGRADIDVDQLAVPEIREDVLALDEALDRLQAVDPEAARLVQLRYFAGLTLIEAAEALGGLAALRRPPLVVCQGLAAPGPPGRLRPRDVLGENFLANPAARSRIVR